MSKIDHFDALNVLMQLGVIIVEVTVILTGLMVLATAEITKTNPFVYIIVIYALTLALFNFPGTAAHFRGQIKEVFNI